MQTRQRFPMLEVIEESWANRHRLFTLSLYDLQERNSGTWLGFLWNFLNPTLQILVYWFVFAIGFKSSAPKGEHTYLMWMIVGIIPWFYMSEAMMGSTMAIYNFRDVLKKMHFPAAIVPIKTVMSALLSHIMAMVVVMGIFFASGYGIGIHFFGVFYFMAASFAFLAGFAMFASSITVVFKDFQKLLSAVIRLLFYISPVVWSPDVLPEKMIRILKLNPFDYLINGYRDCILYNLPITANWQQGMYFWGVTLVLLQCGCALHMRLRKRFMDVI